jgi:hypothetical protein
MSDELYSQKIKQIRKYAEWERDNNGTRLHVLDWAANEIESLHSKLACRAEEPFEAERLFLGYAGQWFPGIEESPERTAALCAFTCAYGLGKKAASHD